MSDINKFIERANKAQQLWKETSSEQRSELLEKVCEVIEDKKQEIANTFMKK